MTKARELAKLGEVMTNSQIGSRRNIILNPKMAIAQRGTSVSSATTATFIVDRFLMQVSSLGTWTLSQSTDVPTGEGFSNSFKFDCTTANASPSAGAFLSCKQKIEAQNLQQLKYGTSSAESVTISFYVRSNKTGTYIFELIQPDASNRHRGASYTINSADTWERKVITFTGDTSGVINNDNGDGMQLTWWLGSGSNFSSGTLQTDWGALSQADRAVGNVNLADSTDNEWYITGVQMEVGSYPNGTPFEHRSFGEELALCQRYYFGSTYGDSTPGSTGAFGTAHSTNEANVGFEFPTTMRATPTVTVFDASGNANRIHRAQVGDHGNSANANNVNVNGVGQLQSSSMTTGGGYLSGINADAEL